MLMLVCDTSNSTCCAGLYADGRELEYKISLEKKTHSETFMPLVEDVIKASGKTWKDIEAIACTVGPGSYTGIRIGLSAVKGMSLALNIPCVSISSTKALAASVSNVTSDEKKTLLLPCFDARNKRVFAACYENSDYSSVISEGAYAALDFVEELLKIDDIFARKVIVLGDGSKVIEEAVKSLEEALKLDIEYAPGTIITPSGINKVSVGEPLISGAEISASYCAVSQAERLRKD